MKLDPGLYPICYRDGNFWDFSKDNDSSNDEAYFVKKSVQVPLKSYEHGSGSTSVIVMC